MNEKLLNGKITLYSNDCLKALATLEENSIDSCVTDPPYHLISIVKRFGAENAAPAKFGKDGVFQRSSKGFMGKQWDGGDIAANPEIWELVYRALKPGAHLIAFGGTRTYHRMVCAIEDAGFDIRDTLMWVYGTGFPKSHDVSKRIDKLLGAKRDIIGYQKNIHDIRGNDGKRYAAAGRKGPIEYIDLPITEPATDIAREWEGWGTALKPACEPIVLARKPLSEKTTAENILKWGTGAINIDKCRVPTTDKLGGGAENPDTDGVYQKEGWDRPWMHNEKQREAHSNRIRTNVAKAEKLGRFPANILHDGSDEVVNMFPARFFYTAKADDEDRLGAKHPTVKPLDLMQWLVRLVTPKGGVCIDPFAGTGTTGEAAVREGMQAILIEKEPEYQDDIRFRMECFNMPPKQRKFVAKNREYFERQKNSKLCK